MSMLFAATYPERTAAIVLYGAYAQYPDRHRLSDAQFEAMLEESDRIWGTGVRCLRRLAPTRAEDKDALRAWARWGRRGASPSAAIALTRVNWEIDIRHVLPAIRVPTLIFHRNGDTA